MMELAESCHDIAKAPLVAIGSQTITACPALVRNMAFAKLKVSTGAAAHCFPEVVFVQFISKNI